MVTEYSSTILSSKQIPMSFYLTLVYDPTMRWTFSWSRIFIFMYLSTYLGFHKAFMKTEIHFPWKFKCDFTKTFTTIEWMKIVLSYLPQNPLRDTMGWNPFRGGAFLLTSTHLRNHSMFFLRVGHETTYTYISLEKTSKLYFGLNNTQTEIQVFMLLQN